uniref:Zinc ribbon domain protein n=1 Tax=Siphoviridae sp. cteLh2 TaxID=2825590 RepID=A0A8S5U5U6_9CAUD|nr:MAG TPA: zinc ribbon domain protein [Siphoviridae sp. cteLh2]
MCEYCDTNNTYKAGISDWTCYFNEKDNKWHVYTEVFRNEYSDFEVNYCPNCGRSLTSK